MRKFFAKVHLWLSIPFGIIIAIVCLTGAILVFETEILELGYPSRYFVKEVKGEPLSPATLIESARPVFTQSYNLIHRKFCSHSDTVESSNQTLR